MHPTRLLLPLLAVSCVVAAEPAIQVVPRQVSIQQSMDYDQDGAAKRGTVRTQLDLNLTPPAGWNIAGIGAIEVTEWLCEDGTAMVPDTDRMRGFSSMRRMGSSGPISVSLYASQNPVGKQFKSVAGTVVLQVADGAVKEALLKPVKELVGQAIEVDGIPGAVLEIESWNEREVTIGYPRDLESRIQSIELRTAAGDKIETNGWGSNGSNDHISRTLRSRVPADGQVAVRIIPKLKDVVVPFALSNVALPSSDPVSRKPAKKITAAPVTDEPKPESAPVKPVKPAGGQPSNF